MFGAKSGKINIRDTYMYYVTFGRGKKPLVMIPGLSTKGLKGSESMLAYMYRIFSRKYKVYIFDRIDTVPDGYSVYDMADDTAAAMAQLDIKNACVFGVSQGGMIAQVIAANYPDAVDKLVLGVTLSKQNETIETVVDGWMEYARRGDYKSLNREIFTLMYSERYLKKHRLMMPIAVRLAKPENLNKFMILAKACTTFDGYADLEKIKCPTLVLGGARDKVVTGRASEEIAERLGCDIYMYDELGHAAYDEAKDFNKRIYEFLQS